MNKPKTKGGLGRGLSALIPQVMSGGRAEESVQGEGEVSLEIKRITANPFQPRRSFDEDKLQELTASIKEHGVFQPIMVRKKEDGYELIAGERRLRAAIRAGLKTIPAIVREMSDEKVMELAIIENIQRQDLNPVEEARAYKRLSDEFKMTQEQIAKRLSKSRPYIANTMRLLNLPEPVLDLLAEGKLTAGHVRPLLPLAEDQAIQIAQQLAEQKATVREAELWARRASDPGFFKAGSLDRIFGRYDDDDPGEEESRPAFGEAAAEPEIGGGAERPGQPEEPEAMPGAEGTGAATGASKPIDGAAAEAAPETEPWAGPADLSGGAEKVQGKTPAKEQALPVELKEIQRVLREQVNTKVEITAGAKGGKIIIDYYTQDDLERILDLFAGKREID